LDTEGYSLLFIHFKQIYIKIQTPIRFLGLKYIGPILFICKRSPTSFRGCNEGH